VSKKKWEIRFENFFEKSGKKFFEEKISRKILKIFFFAKLLKKMEKFIKFQFWSHLSDFLNCWGFFFKKKFFQKKSWKNFLVKFTSNEDFSKKKFLKEFHSLKNWQNFLIFDYFNQNFLSSKNFLWESHLKSLIF